MKTYGQLFDDQMLKRMKRDGIPTVTKVVFNRCNRYALRGYVMPASNPDEVYFFHLRRDGRVEKSWVPLSKSLIMETCGELSQ